MGEVSAIRATQAMIPDSGLLPSTSKSRNPAPCCQENRITAATDAREIVTAFPSEGAASASSCAVERAAAIHTSRLCQPSESRKYNVDFSIRHDSPPQTAGRIAEQEILPARFSRKWLSHIIRPLEVNIAGSFILEAPNSRFRLGPDGVSLKRRMWRVQIA
jgi:hypothetical protein